jgi:hypothetical protein
MSMLLARLTVFAAVFAVHVLLCQTFWSFIQWDWLWVWEFTPVGRMVVLILGLWTIIPLFVVIKKDLRL